MTSAPHCKACGAELSHDKSRGHKGDYNLLACTACGSVTVDPFPTVAELVAFYQNYKGTTDYRKKQKRKIERAMRRIRRLRRYTRGRRFLDVGCNYGFTVRAALNLKLDAFGIDMDETAVRGSQQMFGTDKFEAVSVEHYAERGGKADIIYTSEVIEHVPDPDSFIKAISSILADSGVLYLTTPDSGHWRVPRNFAKWKEVMPPEHITYFTRNGMKRLLDKHGLEVEKFFFALKPGMRLIARKKPKGKTA